ncbi:DUF3283 family protein [Vibrio genomosp. F10]|uniref:Pyridoxamine 5-phosphate oxidase n=1 Tax=Vibrio genomosp. F10 str. ZF-129 TaxID=1187848 RepID=A0A1E5B9U6_9VIBR|nr:DUF3283 family protein [Vibrio genomosp. F10]OEE30688.1 pyridoxamine 5-phosphate oxidase [Vibrio genomosp. F10 str. ZF-129]OEE96773.1 pyridoxamine 5-phosphate oxidase [Vibrio genomosp. F10 str. 9ZC157]OEF06264.1 pyridoxamine 5-phosphate oxidase [Vibrio genomosp. F10 str. 9ZD137]OEF08434.1 pyridoxamine 5-phosphate oxidase [Vibrio genomosp. F10 str. 9ZB36]
MTINLSQLPTDEKNKIELDKQASFLVWKLREAKAIPSEIIEQKNNITDEQQREWFEQSISKYKRVMGVM